MAGSELLLVTLILAGAAACAALLRAASCPGWPVLGGVVAGICLGPTIFGRVAPVTFEQIFVGATQQREAVLRLRSRHHADLTAASMLGLHAQATTELREEHAREVADAEEELATARWEHQRPLRAFTMIIIALTLLGAGPLRVASRGEPQSWIAAVSIGLWSAAIPGALAAAALIWWTEVKPWEALLAASAVAIGPWILTNIDRAAADEAEHGGARLVQAAGRIASICTIAAAVVAIVVQRGESIAAWSLVLLALPAGWALPRLYVADAAEPVTTAVLMPALAGRIWRGSLDHLLVPTLAALAVIKVELIEQFAVVPLIVFLLLSGDGRWLGAVLGAVLPGGRRGPRTMRLVLGSMACGPTQLAVTALAAHLAALPGSIVMGLVAGAVLIEITAPARRSVANRLIETEEMRE